MINQTDFRTVTGIHQSLAKITTENGTFLAIPVAKSNRSQAVKRFTDLEQTEGTIIADENLSPWTPNGLMEHEGTIYLYGPYYEGRMVDEVLQHDSENALDYLFQLAHSFALMRRGGIALPRFQTNAMMFLDDGGMLFFPTTIMERIRSTQIEEERIQSYELFNNPDLKGEDNLSYALGVLCYKIFTGVYPFTGESEEEIHNCMRELELLEPRYRKPELSPDASIAIQETLRKGKETRLSFEEWEEKLRLWKIGGVLHPVDALVKTQLLAKGIRVEKKARRKFNFQTFCQRNVSAIILISLITATVGVFSFSLIRNALKPRATQGMEPLEVVELYYSSMTKLDHMAMEDCIVSGQGKPDVNEATNLFVISRMRLGQEGTVGYMGAQEWKEAGMPDINEGYYVYGVSDLEITELSGIEMLVSYEKWEQPTETNVANAHRLGNSVQYTRKDKLTLEYDGKYWVISELQRLNNDLTADPN